MHPILFNLFGLPLHMYGLSIALGFLLIVYLMQRDFGKLGISGDDISEMAFGVLLVGAAGTRLLHIIMFPQDYSLSDPIGWIAVWRGGLVFQGALFTAIPYAWWALRKRGIPFWLAADHALPYVPIAQAFGRMGCFFNGCCFGEPTAMPWGLSFPPGSPVAGSYPDPAGNGWSMHVHPTQLYSVVLLLTMSGLMLFMRGRWTPFAGYMFPMYFILYGIKRFIVECFRGDHNPTNLGGGILSNQQVICVAMIFIGGAAFAYMKRNPPRMVWPPAAKPELGT